MIRNTTSFCCHNESTDTADVKLFYEPLSCFSVSHEQIECMIENNKITMIWRQRLGHPSAHAFDKVLSLVDDHITFRKVDFCDSCPLGKSHRLFHGLSNFRAKAYLEIVYSDFWGPTLTIQ